MLRHTDQWRFGVFWQDDGTSSDGQGGSTGFSSSVSYGGAPPGQGGIGSDAVAGGTAGAPAGVSYGGGQSFGGVSRGGSTAAPSGGVAASTTGGGAGTTGAAATGGGPGAATGGGGGTAAGGSASGPGGGGTALGGSAGGGGTSIGDIAAGFFSSIMGSPANAKSLYGDPGSAAAYMNPQQIRAINQQLAQGQPSTPAFGNIGVQSLIDALSGNALGDGLGNVAQGTPSPTLGSLALAIALGDTFGALGGQAPGGATPGYGDQATMGYPALEGVSPGLTAQPAGPSQAPFGGAISAPGRGGIGSDAVAGGTAGATAQGDPGAAGSSAVGTSDAPPASPYGNMPSPADFGPPSTPMAPAVTGVPMMGPMGPFGGPNDISTTNLSPSQTPYGVPPPGPQYGPNMSDVAPYGGMPSPSDFGTPSATTGTPSLTNTIATQPPAVSAKAVAQAIANQPSGQQAQTISDALDVAQQTMTPAAYEQFVGQLLTHLDPNTMQEWSPQNPGPQYQPPAGTEDPTQQYRGGPGVQNPFLYDQSPRGYSGRV